MSTISASTTSTTAFKVTSDTTGTLVFQTGAVPTTAISIDASQAVGIGTSTPAQKLTVNGGLASIGPISALTASSTFFDYNTTLNSGRFAVVGNTTGTAAPIVFSQYSSNGSVGRDAVTIDSSGNLGIGTSSPVNNANRKTLALQGAWGGQLDIMVGSTVHAQFGTDNFTSGQSCRIQSQDGIVFNTGGATERMRLDSSGNLGLGVTPSAWSSYKPYQVGWGALASTAATQNTLLSSNVFFDGANFKYIGTGTASYLQQFDGSFIWKTAPSGTAGNAISFTQAMTLDASGNLIVGGTSPVISGAGRGNITINGSSTAVMALSVGGSAKGWVYHDNTNLEINAGSAGAMIMYTAGSERARISSTGQVFIGGTTNSYNSALHLFNVNGGTSGSVLESYVTGTTSAYHAIYLNANGAVGGITTSGTATAYNTSSDYRLKNTIAPMTGALAKVALLKPCTYKWNADGSDGQGFIAHELAEVVPQCVTGEKDAVDAEGKPRYQGVDTSFLVATLTAAIQELTARVAQLESK